MQSVEVVSVLFSIGICLHKMILADAVAPEDFYLCVQET